MDDQNSWKIVIPTELRNEVLYAAHNQPNSSHCGIAKTTEIIRRYFYWPRLVTDVKEYIGKCEICKTSKIPTSILRPPMGHMINTERPFQRLYIDLIGPFPRTRNGNVGILIVLDHFSKFTFLRPLKKLVSQPIVSYLREEIFMCYGVPQVIISDNGSQFKSKDFEKLLETFGIKHQFTAVYSPQSNASERVNRTINAALRAYVRQDHRTWDRYLPSVNCALRNTTHATTCETPYQLIFGQHMITHGKDFDILRRLHALEDSDLAIQRRDQFTLLRDTILTKFKSAYEKNERIYNLR